MSTLESIANELHRPARKIFPRRSVVTRFIDDLWQADLMDMQSHSKKNFGFKFLLVVIVCYVYISKILLCFNIILSVFSLFLYVINSFNYDYYYVIISIYNCYRAMPV